MKKNLLLTKKKAGVVMLLPVQPMQMTKWLSNSHFAEMALHANISSKVVASFATLL